MERKLEILVKNPKNQVLSVEKVLRSQGGLTRKEISRAKFRSGGIRKNGRQCRVTERTEDGDVLQICLEEAGDSSEHLLPAGAGLPALEILYEDTDLLAVNKPAGVVTHPRGVHYQDTLANQIADYCRGKGEKVRIRSIGRLDKDTSGIVIFAKNQVAAARLQRQREEGVFQKTYLALTAGELPEQDAGIWCRIDIPIQKDPENPKKMAIVRPGASGDFEGKRAVTYYHVVKSTPEWSVVKVRLETGRTHQIRVHMAATGHPLLGDSLYGNVLCSGETLRRAALHAYRCELQHPFSGEGLFLEASIPPDLMTYVR